MQTTRLIRLIAGLFMAFVGAASARAATLTDTDRTFLYTQFNDTRWTTAERLAEAYGNQDVANWTGCYDAYNVAVMTVWDYTDSNAMAYAFHRMYAEDLIWSILYNDGTEEGQWMSWLYYGEALSYLDISRTILYYYP